MELSGILGGAVLDFTLPSLGGVVADDGCSCSAGSVCEGTSTCTNSAGKYCPTNYKMCSSDACKEFVSNSGSCYPADIVCGGGVCSKNKS